MKVLVIDDDPTRHQNYKEVFAKFKPEWEAYQVEGAEGACRLFKEYVFDIAFFDHDLGYQELTGSDIASKVLMSPEMHNPKMVVVHSANPVGARNIVSKFQSAGVEAWSGWDYDILQMIKEDRL